MVTPTPKSRESGESSQKVLDDSTASDTKSAEGWVRLHINPDAVIKHGVEPTFRDFVAQANIPKDDQSRLFVQILEAYYYSNATRREQFLRCQLYAISSLCMYLPCSFTKISQRVRLKYDGETVVQRKARNHPAACAVTP